jgi:anti-sigma regulatory factor (Ser/Thr protein kinase)
MRTEHHFGGSATSVREARLFVTEALLGAPREAIEDAVLIVSELAANAVTHAKSAFTICVEHRAAVVRIEVRDGGAGAPTPRHPTADEVYGRGLQIVDRLAHGWGVHAHPGGGKTVWVNIALAQPGRTPP